MLTLKHALRSAGVLALLLSVISPSALASDCNMLSSNVDDARTRLKRATNETDFESAKNYAKRVKSALEDAAMSAMDCKCHAAYNEFTTAASYARWARDANDPEAFVDALNRAIGAFNAAIDALHNCARRRQ